MTDQQVWFVTGASRGLGRSIVSAALQAGHLVAATARDPRSIALSTAQHADRLAAIALDVTDPDAAGRAVTEAVRRFGRIDVVVNNAGYANIAPIEQVALDDFRAQVDAVFYGTVHVTRAALPHLRARRRGHVIQIASTGGRITAAGAGAYHSAKFAVEGFSGVLRQEVAPLGIKVTVAEPGAMRTDYAGSSMTVAEFRADYDSTVGATARHLRAHTGREPIDPDRVARVLVDVAAMDQPPFHLVLGSNPVRYVGDAMRTNCAEDARWAALGATVDFPPEQPDQLGVQAPTSTGRRYHPGHV